MSLIPGTVSKAEFARRRRVSPARVSQWISAKKIFGKALVGEGRDQVILEALACEQLRQTLDTVQMTANGIATDLGDRLPLDDPQTPTPGSLGEPEATPTSIEGRIKLARLEQIERQNRASELEEHVQAGRLVIAADVKAEMVRLLKQQIDDFDGFLHRCATALSAELKIEQRGILHGLRQQFRAWRGERAQAARSGAATLPQLDEVPVTRIAEASAEPWRLQRSSLPAIYAEQLDEEQLG